MTQSKSATHPEVFDGHNELVVNSIEREIAGMAKFFKTLSPKEQNAFLKAIGARRIGEATA